MSREGPAGIVVARGRVVSVKRHHERNLEFLRERHGEYGIRSEVSVHQRRLQSAETQGGRGDEPRALERKVLEVAEPTAAMDQMRSLGWRRLPSQLRAHVVRFQALQRFSLAADERFRLGQQLVAIDEDHATASALPERVAHTVDLSERSVVTVRTLDDSALRVSTISMTQRLKARLPSDAMLAHAAPRHE